MIKIFNTSCPGTQVLQDNSLKKEITDEGKKILRQENVLIVLELKRGPTEGLTQKQVKITFDGLQTEDYYNLNQMKFMM